MNEHAPRASFPLVGNSTIDAKTPLMHIDKLARVASKEFKLLHKEARPGSRVLDMFLSQIRVLKDKKPLLKKSEGFKNWIQETFLPKLRQAVKDPNMILLFSNGSMKKELK